MCTKHRRGGANPFLRFGNKRGTKNCELSTSEGKMRKTGRGAQSKKKKTKNKRGDRGGDKVGDRELGG